MTPARRHGRWAELPSFKGRRPLQSNDNPQFLCAVTGCNATSSSSHARRCAGVDLARTVSGRAGAIAVTIVFRVSVAISASSVRKLCTGSPSGQSLVVCLRIAASDRCAGATTLARAASAASLSVSPNSIGTSFWRMCYLRQIELRLVLGLGRLGHDDPVFAMPDGASRSPDNLSCDRRRAVIALTLPPIMFHALRHTHASALIAAGLDVLTFSRWLGQGTPAFTLMVYGHLFSNTDAAAAGASDAAMGRAWRARFQGAGSQSGANVCFVRVSGGRAGLTVRQPTPRKTTANAVLNGAYLPAEGWPSG
jgi:hypothetical protein